MPLKNTLELCTLKEIASSFALEFQEEMFTEENLEGVSLSTATDRGLNRSMEARTICWRIVLRRFLADKPAMVWKEAYEI